MSAGERAIPLRMRPDLDCRAFGSGESQYWRIKDPLSDRHYELGQEEFFVLQRLDGQTSVSALQAACERRFAPRQASPAGLMSFIARLHAAGLLVGDAPRQHLQVLERLERRNFDRRAWGWTNLLALRWRGIDPEPVLAVLDPLVRWMFSPWALAAGLLTMLAALGLLAVQADEVTLRWPEMKAFFSLRNVGWLALSVAAVKTLHELAHALACRRYGGRCHELGVLLLVFVPCLYCNVSDAWLFGSRWRRIAVDVAGIYVELVVAAAATLLWWFSVPGWFNSACFNLMVVCSVGTVLFNGNPLLRYDGYYLLADVFDIPNLHERSAAALRRLVVGPLVRDAAPRDQLFSEPGGYGLALYGLASLAYRWFVSLGICWFCFQALKPYRLEVLALLLTGVMGAALLAGSVRQVCHFAASPLAGERLHRPRLMVALALLILGAVGLWKLELPHRIHVPALVAPAAARRVYVSVPGRLTAAARTADRVDEGAPLAQLENREMDLEIAKLRGERDRQRTKLENLKRQQIDQPEAGSEIPTAEAALSDLERRLDERLGQRAAHRCGAVHGTVLPPRPRPVTSERGELVGWSGHPLDETNRGCFLETGTLLCLVGDPHRLEALLLVDEDQVEFVRPGQKVLLLVDELPDRTVEGVVAELAQIDVGEAPPELVERGQLPTRTNASRGHTPVRTYYQARIALQDESLPLVGGATGQAKILADPIALGPRLLRFLSGTFRFLL